MNFLTYTWDTGEVIISVPDFQWMRDVYAGGIAIRVRGSVIEIS